MGMLCWVMVGLAVWHFTVFIPDHFWGGIVGAFVAALIGSALFGFIVHAGSVPGNDDVSLLTAAEGIPGAVLGLGFCYWNGLRLERKAGVSYGL